MANKNVSSDRPCPICGKEDWCYWLPYEHGELLCCARSENAQDAAIQGNDGTTYYVKKPKTAQGFCIYESATAKQLQYEQWCAENGVKPKDRYTGVIGASISIASSAQNRRPSDEELSDKIAEPERLDEVYRAFLSLLKLEKRDELVLRGEWQGLYDQIVGKYMICSMPPSDNIRFRNKSISYFANMRNLSRKRIMEQLVQKVGEPFGVPGFFINSFTNQWTFCSLSGIVFPSIDLRGRIIRLRVRDALPSCSGTYNGDEGKYSLSYNGEWEFERKSDKNKEIVFSFEKNICKIELTDDFMPGGTELKVNGKYKNFSSCYAKYNNGNWENGYLHGTRSGSMPSVYAEPNDDFYTIYFTEGEKKAIVAHELLKAPVIAFPGVGFYSQMTTLSADNFDKLVEEYTNSILYYLIQKGAKIGVICYDADKETNNKVLSHEAEAIKLFIKNGLYMAIGEWNSGYGKGLDDIAIAGIRPTIHPVILQ